MSDHITLAILLALAMILVWTAGAAFNQHPFAYYVLRQALRPSTWGEGVKAFVGTVIASLAVLTILYLIFNN